ncbi:hypothetical protein K466DRAFT_621372 [Polyporus arcularius HHB13444]|uniref:Uncharacterized protein n=1 Tax=Polyporus arcularius HHB13444 TaxID=1314778 RepID=A0A5C3PC40_9APHY|nr:hypothetical protein K466DRAFT_621372 [Polyporus arcularius HHB13444]
MSSGGPCGLYGLRLVHRLNISLSCFGPRAGQAITFCFCYLLTLTLGHKGRSGTDNGFILVLGTRNTRKHFGTLSHQTPAQGVVVFHLSGQAERGYVIASRLSRSSCSILCCYTRDLDLKSAHTRATLEYYVLSRLYRK